MRLNELVTESVMVGISNKKKPYFNKVISYLKNKFSITAELYVNFSASKDLDKTQDGACFALGRNPSKIEIYIDGNKEFSNNDILRILCHEMIHAHQISRGDLALIKEGENQYFFEWMGKRTVAKYSRSNEWEVEAHANDRKLMIEVINKFGNLIE